MKLIHLSDLHLGKRVNEFSMIGDQKYIMEEIVKIIQDESPDGILVAGDVYDRSVPSEDAMRLWDKFLVTIAEMKIPLYAIGGNHDSQIRLADHNDLIEHTGIHISSEYNGDIASYELKDESGIANIYLLPFVKPATVKNALAGQIEEDSVKDYTDALKIIIDRMNVDTTKRNILIAHQFVVGASRCESEEITVGGLDEVAASVFEPFDYVALGHLHGPQRVWRDTIRYCGTPLKYSISEKDHKKSVTVVEIGAKEDEIAIRTIPLIPLHDMREIRGDFEKVLELAKNDPRAEDYVHIVLTDEDDVINAFGKLSHAYPNLMKLSYDNARTRAQGVSGGIQVDEQKTEIELFEDFYMAQNGQGFTEEQRELLTTLIEELKM